MPREYKTFKQISLENEAKNKERVAKAFAGINKAATVGIWISLGICAISLLFFLALSC